MGVNGSDNRDNADIYSSETIDSDILLGNKLFDGSERGIIFIVGGWENEEKKKMMILW